MNNKQVVYGVFPYGICTIGMFRKRLLFCIMQCCSSRIPMRGIASLCLSWL